MSADVPADLVEAGAVKTCTKCGATKSVEKFHRDRQAFDGRRRDCGECVSARAREWSASPRGRKAGRDRKRTARAEGRVKETPEKRRRDYDATKGTPQYVARYTLRNHVANGRVIKPSECQDCGESGPIHGHHHDYSKPLDVEWLCVKCHYLRHRKDDE